MLFDQASNPASLFTWDTFSSSRFLRTLLKSVTHAWKHLIWEWAQLGLKLAPAPERFCQWPGLQSQWVIELLLRILSQRPFSLFSPTAYCLTLWNITRQVQVGTVGRKEQGLTTANKGVSFPSITLQQRGLISEFLKSCFLCTDFRQA